MTFEQGQALWQLIDSVVSIDGCDLDGERQPGSKRVDLHWREWHVERATAKGAWIRAGAIGDVVYQERRWVSRNTYLVADTKESAKANAIRKRRYHVKMSRQRLDAAEQRLRALERCNVA